MHENTRLDTLLHAQLPDLGHGPRYSLPDFSRVKKAITFSYADDTGATIHTRGIIVSLVRAKGVVGQVWDVTYLAAV